MFILLGSQYIRGISVISYLFKLMIVEWCDDFPPMLYIYYYIIYKGSAGVNSAPTCVKIAWVWITLSRF